MTVEYDMWGDRIRISPMTFQPRDFVGSTGTDMEETDERYGGQRDGLFEEVGDVVSGGKREEEDHIEGHCVWPRSSLLQLCED